MTDQAEKKHSAFWGVMVIAGTVIGGGMFALPVDLAGAWFFWGAFILIIARFSMLHSGLLLLEANLNYPVGSSFNTITKDLIGNTRTLSAVLPLPSFSISSLMPISLLMVRSLVKRYQ